MTSEREREFHPINMAFLSPSLSTGRVDFSRCSFFGQYKHPCMHRPREIRAVDRTAAAASGGVRRGGVIGMRVHFSAGPTGDHALIRPRFLNNTPHLELQVSSFSSFWWMRSRPTSSLLPQESRSNWAQQIVARWPPASNSMWAFECVTSGRLSNMVLPDTHS